MEKNVVEILEKLFDDWDWCEKEYEPIQVITGKEVKDGDMVEDMYGNQGIVKSSYFNLFADQWFITVNFNGKLKILSEEEKFRGLIKI